MSRVEGCQEQEEKEVLMTHFPILDKRLRRVESQNRRLWWLVIGLTVFAASTVAWGQTDQRPVVKARELDLCDEAGHVRGQFIGWGDGAPVLELYGVNQIPNAMLSANQLGIFAPKGGIVAVLGSNHLRFIGEGINDSANLSVNNKSGKGELRFNENATRNRVVITPQDLLSILGPSGK